MSDPNEPNGTHDDDVFVADPDALEDDFDGELPGWTKPVGVTSVIWGILLVICGGIGTASAAFQPQLMQSMSSQMQGGIPPAMQQVNTVAVALGIAGLIWAVLNIVAGVLTLGRNYSGRIVHLIWAIGAIVILVASAKVQLDVQGEIAQWVEANPDADFARQQQQTGAIGQAIGAILLLIFVIWPAFCLFWFGFVKKTEKDFTGGVDLNY